MGRDDQRVTAGRLMSGLSFCWLVISASCVWFWTAHSSFCSSRRAPTRRTTAPSIGKMPTTSVRRMISPVAARSDLSSASRRDAPWGGHVGQHVGLRVIYDGGELGHLRTDPTARHWTLAASGVSCALECAARPCRPASPNPARCSRCTASSAAGSSRH